MSVSPGALRIALDARPLSHPQAGGFRTYVRALLCGLRERAAEGATDISLLIYVDRPLAPSVEGLLPAGSALRVLQPSRLKTDWRFFPRQLRRDAPDLLHGTMNYAPFAPAPMTLTVHDAMGLKRYPFLRVDPSARQRFINWYWERMTRASVARARRVVTVSRSAADELSTEFPGVQTGKFCVVYNGLDLPKPASQVARAPGGAVLALSSPDPRKNLRLLYAALSRERQRFGAAPPRLDVVCTSAVSAARAAAAMKEHGIDDFRLLTELEDQALSDAYAAAPIFAWPSRREGFGMPPLEAMRCGCPVVSSSAQAMPEILGDAPVYFDDLEQPAELAQALASLLNDSDRRASMAARGRLRAAEFTCRRMAEETVDAWKAALGAGDRP